MLRKFMITTVPEHTVLVQNGTEHTVLLQSGTEFDGKLVHGSGLSHRNSFNSDFLLISHCAGSFVFGVCASISKQNQYGVPRNASELGLCA